MLISDILQDGGFRVIEAKNTMEALRVLEARPDVQVIFTDAEMPPGPTGFELARQVCKGWPYIEIIIRQGERGPPLATCPIPAYSFRSLGQQQALPGMFRKPQIGRWRADKYRYVPQWHRSRTPTTKIPLPGAPVGLIANSTSGQGSSSDKRGRQRSRAMGTPSPRRTPDRMPIPASMLSLVRNPGQRWRHP